MCRLLALAPLLFVIACGRSEPSELNHPAVAPLASSVSTDRVLVIRTDFADDARWRAAWAGIMTQWQVHERVPEVTADVDALDDRSFSGVSVAELVPRLQGYQPRYVFVADAETMSAGGHPVIVVDLHGDSRGEHFRAKALDIAMIDSNLGLGNMDFEDFASRLDGAGVFRGFE